MTLGYKNFMKIFDLKRILLSYVTPLQLTDETIDQYITYLKIKL